MAQIRHIAITTPDVEATARFYVDVMGLKQIAKVDSPNADGYYLSDGHINLAILNFKNDAAAGAEFGKEYAGIHHIGFQVDDLDEMKQTLEQAGTEPRDDINAALNLHQDGARRSANVEVKYRGPDNIIFDISETGWVGTGHLD